MQKQAKYIQLFGDAIIPLMGLLFWNWSLYFILLFYGLDLLVKEVLLHLKSSKINHFRKQTQSSIWLKYAGISFSLILVSIFLIHVLMPLLHVNFSVQDELIAFWTYEDMGIQQGYVLLPILVVGGYMQYKADFLNLRHFEYLEVSDIWKSHIKSELIILGTIGIILGITQFYIFPNTILVLTIILGSTLYQWLTLNQSKH